MNIYLQRSVRTILLLTLLFLTFSCSNTDKLNIELSRYPDGRDFAFTVTDDPDYGLLEEKPIVYDYLSRLGFKTTIPVWVLDNKHGSGEGGSLTNTRGVTTTNKEYLRYIQELQARGFEICLHTAGPGNDLREETAEGYELFKEQFGHYPNININHANNLENIYWGGDRFSNKFAQKIYSLFEAPFQGDKATSKYFWGDILKEKTMYLRGWATDNINTLSVNKSIPYHLEDKPYVNYWFGCSDGYNYDKFMKLVSDDNISKLVAERGTSIVYTHFAYGFVDKTTTKLKPGFQEQMEKISRLNGWFVPVSTIVERLRQLRSLEIVYKDGLAILINHSNQPINGLTIITNLNNLYFYNKSTWVTVDSKHKVILGDLPAYGVFKLGVSDNLEIASSPGIVERVTMVVNWLIGRFNK